MESKRLITQALGEWILNNDHTSDLAVRVAVEVSFEHFFDHAVLP